MYITYISQHFAAFRVSCGEAVSCPVRSLRRCLDSSARSWLRKGNGSVDTSESWSTIFLRRCGTRRWQKLETKKKTSVVSPIAATFYFYKSFWSVLRSQAMNLTWLGFCSLLRKPETVQPDLALHQGFLEPTPEPSPAPCWSWPASTKASPKKNPDLALHQSPDLALHQSLPEHGKPLQP